MSVYIQSIQKAVLIFFMVLLISLIPYLIHQYRKFGRVSPWKFIVQFSFVLYMIAAYAMTIFPLPSYAQVAAMTGPKQNLHLFEFTHQFVSYSGFKMSETATWLPALKAPSFIQPFFNLLLTVPFGFYLNYLYKKSFKTTVLFSFLLTLSFECIQRSALFGLYPRPYRLFDVDDLLINTIGGLFGFGLAVLVGKILPDLEAKFEVKSAVGMLRRSLAFLLDVILDVILNLFIPVPFVSELIVFVLIPLLFKATLGQLVLKIKINSSRVRIVLRQILSLIFYILVGLEFYFLNRSATIVESKLTENWLMALIVLGLLSLPVFDIIIATFSKSKLLWYEKATRTRLEAKNEKIEEGDKIA